MRLTSFSFSGRRTRCAPRHVQFGRSRICHWAGRSSSGRPTGKITPSIQRRKGLPPESLRELHFHRLATSPSPLPRLADPKRTRRRTIVRARLVGTCLMVGEPLYHSFNSLGTPFPPWHIGRRQSTQRKPARGRLPNSNYRRPAPFHAQRPQTTRPLPKRLDSSTMPNGLGFITNFLHFGAAEGSR